MKKPIIFIMAFFMPLFVFAQDANVVRKRIENVNNDISFQGIIEVASKNSKGTINTAKFRFYSRESGEKQLLVYLEPAKDKGKVILLSEGTYWLYFPRNGSTVKVPSSGSLFANLSNGDLLRAPLKSQYDYTVENSGKEVIGTFKQKSKDATYGKIVFKYGEDSNPKEGELYGKNGILLKKSYYKDYELIGKDYLSKTTLINDSVQNGSSSMIKFSEIVEKDIPESYFNPNALNAIQ